MLIINTKKSQRIEVAMENDLLFNVPVKENKPISRMPGNREWTVVADRLIVDNRPPLRRIYINHILVSEYKIGDAESERIAIMHAFLNGIGNQQQLARIWGVHYNTINNYVAAYRRLGLKGLTELFYEPEARRTEAGEEKVLAVDEQASLFETECNPAGNACIARDMETVEQVLPEEETVEQVVETQYGGSMLYHPLISEMYPEILKKADEIENRTGVSSRTFGLREIILTLIFYIFTGTTNPECGKSLRRNELGVLVGEDRSPCCRTLRKGLDMLTVDDFPSYMNRQLTRQYVRLKYVELGVLYVDGHFIPYYGKKNVHKGYSTQRRIAMPGHYQNWANDRNGRPIFFYVNNSFVKFTDAIMNSVVDTLELMHEAGINERLIVVFDRGGYDGKLFRELDRMQVGFVTWQKGGKERDMSLLTERLEYTDREGRVVTYLSHKDTISINNYRTDVEAITVYDENRKKQSTLVDNLEHVGIMDRTDSYKIQVLDGRWAQENFFKEAKVKVDVDHLMGYQFETDGSAGEDMEYEIINPEYRILKEEIERMEKKHAAYLLKKETAISRFQTLKRKVDFEAYMRQKGNKNILDICDALEKQLQEARGKIFLMPERIKYCDLHDERKDILKTVRSSVILAIRASVYNMRKRFDEMASECFRDHRELSKFILALTTSPATITITNKTYYVKLKKLETPVYQKSAEKLIEKLNNTNTVSMADGKRKIIYQF